jgi:hypothetical protein
MSETAEIEGMGPIDLLMIEWPNGTGSGEGLPLLLDLVERGLIRILDLALVRKNDDGSVSAVEFTELPSVDGFDPTVFEGISSGILDQSDFDDAAAIIEPGAVVGILVYENAWAAPFAVALRRGGAQLIASSRIPVQAVLAALDATESGT